MPMEYAVPSLKIALEHRLGDVETLKERLNTLIKLDEKGTLAQWMTKVAQRRRKF